MEEKNNKLIILSLVEFFPPTFPLLFLNTFSVSPSVSLMAFHHRKLLFQNHHNHGNISPTPSPHQSPVSQLPLPSTLPIPTPEINRVHILQIAVIVMGCMVGVTMFLCTVSVILRGYYYSRRRNHNHSRSRSNSPILFDVNGDGDGDGDSRFSDDGMERVIDHPIWFIRTEGLQQSVIDSITVFKYKKDEGLIEGTECSVCLGEFQQDESLRLLPKCNHAFHILCIDTWLRSHKNCPLCRALVVNGDGGGSDLRVTVTDQSDSSVSGETLNQEGQIEIFDDVAGSYHVEESESSVMRFVGDDDSGVSSSDILPDFLVEEIQPVKRSISMDSSSASTVFHDLNSDRWNSENDLNFGDKMNSSSKDMSKNGSGSSTVGKVASLGRALQKRPRSFSNNTKFLSKHSRSQSSSLPL